MPGMVRRCEHTQYVVNDSALRCTNADAVLREGAEGSFMLTSARV